MALKLPMSWKWEETRPEKQTICFLIPNSFTSWQGWDSNGLHFTQVVKLYMRTIFSLQASQVDIRNIRKTSTLIFSPLPGDYWRAPLQPLLSSLARQQCSRPSSRYHVPDPNFTRWKDGDIWRWNDMTNIKHDQTWSNMTCWDMFFCQTCFHTVCISFIFHSYYIYLVQFFIQPTVFQSYSVSPFRPWRRLHSKSCTKWPAFEANWICDNHLSPLDLRWCGCLAIRSAKSGLNPNQKPHFHKFHQISSISDVISYHVLNI